MEESDITGYVKAILNIGAATSAEVCFNNGTGTWDNNGGKNYIFDAGIDIFDKGTIGIGKPPVTTLTVSANIKGGTYTAGQNVALTSSVAGASIYYTLDGTTPTKSSTKYSSPINISGTTTLKAIAVDTTGEQSAVDTEQYIINSSAPTVSSSKEDCTFTDSLSLTLAATNYTSTTYSINGAAEVAYTNGTTITIGKDAVVGDKNRCNFKSNKWNNHSNKDLYLHKS